MLLCIFWEHCCESNDIKKVSSRAFNTCVCLLGESNQKKVGWKKIQSDLIGVRTHNHFLCTTQIMYYLTFF